MSESREKSRPGPRDPRGLRGVIPRASLSETVGNSGEPITVPDLNKTNEIHPIRSFQYARDIAASLFRSRFTRTSQAFPRGQASEWQGFLSSNGCNVKRSNHSQITPGSFYFPRSFPRHQCLSACSGVDTRSARAMSDSPRQSIRKSGLHRRMSRRINGRRRKRAG